MKVGFRISSLLCAPLMFPFLRISCDHVIFRCFTEAEAFLGHMYHVQWYMCKKLKHITRICTINQTFFF